jgi:hypothetical protein
MKLLRGTRILLACAMGLTLAVTDGWAANGVISLNWGTGCETPVITNLVPTSAPQSLFVSEIGNDQTHRAYQIRFFIADATHHVPDAWRFDAEGCQSALGSLLTINHTPVGVVSKTCPPFQSWLVSSIQIKDYSFLYPGTAYPKTQIRGVLASTYPQGTTSNPAQRYFLAEFRFDHSWSTAGPSTPGTSCGGFETPMCILLLTGEPWDHGAEGTSSYLRMSDGVELPFDPGQTWVTVNGLTGCPRVPAAPSTWGQVKNAYRR